MNSEISDKNVKINDVISEDNKSLLNNIYLTNKDFSYAKLNEIKKEKLPIIYCTKKVPCYEDYFGISIGKIYRDIYERKLLFNNGKSLNKRENEKKNIKHINIFDYIFTIKRIDNEKIIYLGQNDISEILENFSTKEAFTSMLDKNGYIEKKWELNYDLDDIEINYKFN